MTMLEESKDRQSWKEGTEEKTATRIPNSTVGLKLTGLYNSSARTAPRQGSFP